MSAEIIDGRAIAQEILDTLKNKVSTLTEPPVLAIILVGDNPASLAYIRQKLKSAAAIGTVAQLYQFRSTISQKDLEQAVVDIQKGHRGAWSEFLAEQPSNPRTQQPSIPDAIIVQRPLPDHLDPNEAIKLVDPKKDVDGFHTESPFPPPVAQAIIEILLQVLPGDSQNIRDRVGERHVVLVGYGETAGKPIAELLEKHGITPQIIRSKTENPTIIAKNADILITAVGKPGVMTKDWIKPGAIVIDVGTNRVSTPATLEPGNLVTHLVGDCDQSVASIASFLTPVPGGVGPVNVACLMQNVVNTVTKLD